MPINPTLAAQLQPMSFVGCNPDLGSADQLDPGLYKGRIKDITLEADKPRKDGRVFGSGYSFKVIFEVTDGPHKGALQSIYLGIDHSDTDDGRRSRDKMAALLQSTGMPKEKIVAAQSVNPVQYGGAVTGKEAYFKLTDGGKKKDPETGKESTVYYRDFVSKEFFLQHVAAETAAAQGNPPPKQASNSNVNAAPTVPQVQVHTPPVVSNGFPASATPTAPATNGAPNGANFALDMGALSGAMPGAAGSAFG